MRDNIFLVADASYSQISKCAGLGVVNLNTGERYVETHFDIPSSLYAEYRALILSVQIALKNNYDNVVFIYDNKTLNVSMLEKHLKGKIEFYQFLWLKRNYLSQADELAKDAREFYEKIGRKRSSHKNKELIAKFKSYGTKKILQAFSLIANTSEKEIIRGYLSGSGYANALVGERSIGFFRTIVNLLPRENKAEFVKYLNRHAAFDFYKKGRISPQKESVYLTKIHQIGEAYKKKYKEREYDFLVA